MQHNTDGLSLFTQWALALQHLLAISSGSLLVPAITGLPISLTLLFSGISTLIFQYFTRGKIPLFFSCSFVYIGGVLMVKQTGIGHGMTPSMGLCYASLGIFFSGIVYVILGQIVRRVSYKSIKKFVPPVLYGSYIISLGIVMVGDTFNQLTADWHVALICILVAIIVQFYCRGTMKLMPITIGILVATIVSLFEGNADFSKVSQMPWIAQPFDRQYMAFSIFEDFDISMFGLSVLTIIPFVILSTVEHLADLFAISQTTGVNYVRNVGLPRTLSANGLATMVSAVFGAPAMTSFTQTTGLIVINKQCSTRLITMASVLMIMLAFSPKIDAIIASIPLSVIGAATFLMCGMVIVVGIRSMVDSDVNLSSTRNILIFSIVTSLTVGIKFALHDSVVICGLSLSSLTIAAFTGVILNLILPDDEKVF